MARLTPKTPWHLWAVGVLGLAWNAFGAWDYLQTKLENREYLAMAGDSMGVDVDVLIAYYNAHPLWVEILWGLGVWGSVAGSVLLLLRSRFAGPAFLVSLVSFVLSMVYGFTNPIPGTTDMTAGYIFTAVIFVILLGQLLYARAMAGKNVLK